MQMPDTYIWERAKGISGVGVNATPNMVYEIGSVAKTMTAACVLQLADEGVLRLDDSLFMWLDTMPQINPNITIRQLLRHQSGIYDVLSHPNCQPAFVANQSRIWQPEELVAQFIGAPVFAAGAGWQYSNTNYMLLSMIIKRATMRPFYTEIRNRFFTPLGMNTIATPALEPPLFQTIGAPVAHVWLDITGDGVTEDAHNFFINYLSLNSAAGAAGCYYATAAETTRWMRAYMRGDVISAARLAEAKVTVAAPGLPATTYGLGLMKKNFVGFDGYGHGGDLAYSASSWYFPTQDLSITVLNNDAKNNSWTLAPVVAALLKTYNKWEALVGTTEKTDLSLTATTFPNPFSGALNVQISAPLPTKNVEIRLTDALGRTVLSQNIAHLPQGSHTITIDDAASLSAGVYFVAVVADGRVLQSLKVVK